VNEELKRDLESALKTVRTREKDLATKDSRLNKALEETERLKNQLKSAKDGSKQADLAKELEDSKTLIKLLEKQRDEV